ncbi:4-alpha-glucanotransferase, partial [Klebsiella aerogenes]|uniref:4-alpha-glucanotransferase n=1 Tax=Klebsiella aerogenes TaxID=548 RepID=UPI0013D7B819
TWKDSYPYAAISAFALHPIYINLEAVAGKDFDAELKKLAVDRKKLNALTVVDYDAVIELKEKFLRTVYSKKGDEVLD